MAKHDIATVLRSIDASDPVPLTLRLAVSDEIERLQGIVAKLEYERYSLRRQLESEAHGHQQMTLAAEANAGSMRLMAQLLRLLLPDRKNGCLCDGCVSTEIEIVRQKH